MLRDWPGRHETLREIRPQGVLTLRGQRMTFDEIGQIIGATRQQAERIAKGRRKAKSAVESSDRSGSRHQIGR
ncbi:hypothetical protein [Phaeacidiphilus oryzae]|uniref:hypothetical protein n=1 Tax=Phaeacidiphilus oryzae TaxID=348818 RepID=UPI000B0BA673|nr:hypothetical protein [Phaeacidiphilus oryzae]